MFEIAPEVRITNEAALAFKESFVGQNISIENIRLRVGANQGGCSGWRWELETEDLADKKDSDSLFESNGIKIIIDSNILYNVIGDVSIDFVKTNLVEQGFVFIRNSGQQCGCGESFTPINQNFKDEI